MASSFKQLDLPEKDQTLADELSHTEPERSDRYILYFCEISIRERDKVLMPVHQEKLRSAQHAVEYGLEHRLLGSAMYHMCHASSQYIY